MLAFLWKVIVFWLWIFGLRGDPDSGHTDSLNEIYESAPPIPDYGAVVDEQVLVRHKFGNSWGKSAIVDYSPPDIEFNAVVLTIDWTVSGVQYDRLAHVYLDDVEIWRPSTPEPGGRSVHSNFSIDASTYLTLFKKKAKLELELNNLVDDRLTGVFDTTLSVKYYQSSDTPAPIWLADRVPDKLAPVVRRTAYTPPELSGQTEALPLNTTRAVIEIIASGNANEEFWYADPDIERAIRVVEVYVGDTLAGYVDPFPVVFTGGFQPRLWWPLVGVHAYDVPRYHIDVTPFLPSLWDGTTIKVRVGNSVNPNVGTGQNWPIAATLLTWETSEAQGVPNSQVPVIFSHTKPQTIRLPGVSTSSVRHIYSSDNDVDFGSGPVHVSWNQTLYQDNSQVSSRKEDVYAYSSDGESGYTYGDAEGTTSHDHDIGLVLARRDIAIGLSHFGHLARVSLNATWGPNAEHNGTDVFVGYGNDNNEFQTHSKARNGDLRKLNEPYTHKGYVLNGITYSEVEEEYDESVKELAKERRDYWLVKKYI